MTDNAITVDYYSDLLCVWAWIAQRRLDELTQQFGAQIQLRYRYINIFGDTAAKMQKQWQDRGGFEGFGKHVQEAACDYEHIQVNPAIWTQTRPRTSANAHLILKAIELTHSAETASSFARQLREAFFLEARDISQQQTLTKLAAQAHLQTEDIQQALDDGAAIAALMSDYQQARELHLKGSPSYILDSGRQTLYGNVGYRVLSANVEELLKRPMDEASWC